VLRLIIINVALAGVVVGRAAVAARRTRRTRSRAQAKKSKGHVGTPSDPRNIEV
jgi:hypothetical protein